MNYQPVIGLEIHVELKTKTKMFCDSLNDPDEKHPNQNICPICSGQPGTLPVINQEAVKAVLKLGVTLGCHIPDTSKFDRKNYFYPDLPKGYQISQYDEPLCRGGHLDILLTGEESKTLPASKRIKIRRIHLEEDTGRLIHPVRGRRTEKETQREQTSNGVHPENTNYSLVDFNRAGIPLMELVTEPDIDSGREARIFCQELRLILRYLGISDADMEKGQMRCEVNISLSPATADGQKILGTKVEIKNLNSFRAVEKAIDYEIEGQTELLENGQKVVQETRGWDENKGKTFSQRSKEEAQEYRYFPEPDLPPLTHLSSLAEELAKEIPELPASRRERFKKEYGLPNDDIKTMVEDKTLGDYFEKTISEALEWDKVENHKLNDEDRQKIIKLTANYLISDLKGLLKERSADISEVLITPENFAEFIKMIHRNEISSRAAKMVLEEMFEMGADPSNIVESKNLKQESDEAKLQDIAREVIKNNPQTIEDYKKGKANALQFLVGQIMKETKGKANPKIVQETLTRLLTKI